MNSPPYTYLRLFNNIGPNNVSRSTEQCRQCRLRSIPHMMSKEVNDMAAGYSSLARKLYINVDNRPKEADGNHSCSASPPHKYKMDAYLDVT